LPVLGVADVRAFGLAWDDLRGSLHQLLISPRVEWLRVIFPKQSLRSV